MLKFARLAVAGVMIAGSATTALAQAQSHFDPTPEHIYFYGPAGPAAAPAAPAKAAAHKAHVQPHHATRTGPATRPATQPGS